MADEQLTRVAAIRAYRAGLSAGAAGYPFTANPYKDQSTVTARALGRYWLRGWRDGAASTPTT